MCLKLENMAVKRFFKGGGTPPILAKRSIIMNQEKIKQFNRIRCSGKLYDPGDPDFFAYQQTLVKKMEGYNQTPETEEGIKEREAILKECVGTYGENLFIIPPLYANCGLSTVHFGKDVFINFDAHFVDDGEIFIGDDVMIGPNCTFATAQHPISPRLRKAKLQYNKSIHIGNNVWLGANVTILPGVSIGDNSVIGAGSVVTKDVASNVIAAGVPARVIRPINEKDDEIYDHDQKVPEYFK